MPEQDKSSYHAYLIRCWRDPDNPLDPWRFSLEEVGVEGPRRGFTSIQDLCGCLIAALDPELDTEDRRPLEPE